MSKSKTIEERYKKLSQIDHILHRPDSYIGSLQKEKNPSYVWSFTEERIIHGNPIYAPGLYKIFDEIIVNAADNKQRDDKMSYIRIVIDKENNTISIENDGESIPIEIHKELNVYVPEMIFGQLLTSDNYDDNDERITGGRNGYGAKLTNIFSKRFTVDIGDSRRKKTFSMEWKNNMSEKSDPVIKSDATTKSYVRISFTPDLPRFGLEFFDNDILSVMYRRAYDLCATCRNVKVYLNDERLRIDNFQDYARLYFEKEDNRVLIHDISKDKRWEIVATLSDGSASEVSFVNCISTRLGGTHVANVVDQIVAGVINKMPVKYKTKVKGHHIKQHLFIFVKSLIVNPSFDSQCKNYLTTKADKFGSQYTIPDNVLTSVIKMGLLDASTKSIDMSESLELQRKLKTGAVKGESRRLYGIPKLEDAHEAGTSKSAHCTLILTEGDSAKTSCLAGLSIVGRNRYGVFPLRGKLLNVREATNKQVLANLEIKNLLQIVGLQIGKVYNHVNSLRYGSIMIMTDQDPDGSHIKGLLLNLFHRFWPELLTVKGFLQQFVTPLVKVSTSKIELSFFSLPEYEKWKQTTKNPKSWKIKYYKGLGTSTDKEFITYFRSLDSHQIHFAPTSGGRSQSSMSLASAHAIMAPSTTATSVDDDLIDMAFSKKRAEDRKTWMLNYEEGTHIDYSNPIVTYSDFINKELVVFSRYDVIRSIPSLMDGLKPGQRKVLFSCFLKDLKNEMKVAQLASYVAEVSCYHHGEQSLCSTIINLAQSFVGTNNLNLLVPHGQFGSRKEGGKDASAARYIFTALSPITRLLFPMLDDALLAYQFEEGTRIEPKYYVPIIPMILVNGCEGIGTGWSSSIPNFDVIEIVQNLKRLLRGEEMLPMKPFYENFKGEIVYNKEKKCHESIGKIEKLNATTLHISELPVKKWTQDYKEFLETLLQDIQEIKEKEMKFASANAATEKAKAKAKATVKKLQEKKKQAKGGKNDKDKRKKAKGDDSDDSDEEEEENEKEVEKQKKKNEFTIKDYQDDSNHMDISFTVTLTPENMKEVERIGLEKAFRLVSSIPTSNMTLFNAQNKIYRYNSELDIIKEFAMTRLELYGERKAYLIASLERQLRVLKNKKLFISLLNKQVLSVSNKNKAAIVNNLIANGIEPYSFILSETKFEPKNKGAERGEVGIEGDEGEDGEEGDDAEDAEEKGDKELMSDGQYGAIKANDFDYLLSLPIYSLTLEKYEKLVTEFNDIEKRYEQIKGISVEAMWDDDLNALLYGLSYVERERLMDMESNKKLFKQNTKKKILVKSPNAGRKKKRRKGESSSEDEDDMEDILFAEDSSQIKKFQPAVLGGNNVNIINKMRKNIYSLHKMDIKDRTLIDQELPKSIPSFLYSRQNIHTLSFINCIKPSDLPPIRSQAAVTIKREESEKDEKEDLFGEMRDTKARAKSKAAPGKKLSTNRVTNKKDKKEDSDSIIFSDEEESMVEDYDDGEESDNIFDAASMFGTLKPAERKEKQLKITEVAVTKKATLENNMGKPKQAAKKKQKDSEGEYNISDIDSPIPIRERLKAANKLPNTQSNISNYLQKMAPSKSTENRVLNEATPEIKVRAQRNRTVKAFAKEDATESDSSDFNLFKESNEKKSKEKPAVASKNKRVTALAASDDESDYPMIPKKTSAPKKSAVPKKRVVKKILDSDRSSEEEETIKSSMSVNSRKRKIQTFAKELDSDSDDLKVSKPKKKTIKKKQSSSEESDYSEDFSD